MAVYEDAAYRMKGMQQVRDYGVDLTVICNEEGLKLTADLAVRETMAPDNAFVKLRQRSVRRKWREMWKKYPWAYRDGDDAVCARGRKKSFIIAAISAAAVASCLRSNR